jgi:hypothetical protein
MSAMSRRVVRQVFLVEVPRAASLGLRNVEISTEFAMFKFTGSVIGKLNRAGRTGCSVQCRKDQRRPAGAVRPRVRPPVPTPTHPGGSVSRRRDSVQRPSICLIVSILSVAPSRSRLPPAAMAHQNRDDGDNDEKFDQCEASTRRWVFQ